MPESLERQHLSVSQVCFPHGALTSLTCSTDQVSGMALVRQDLSAFRLVRFRKKGWKEERKRERERERETRPHQTDRQADREMLNQATDARERGS